MAAPEELSDKAPAASMSKVVVVATVREVVEIAPVSPPSPKVNAPLASRVPLAVKVPVAVNASSVKRVLAALL